MSEPIRPSKSGKLLDAETWDALRKAGVPEEELQADQPFGPIIFAYTRKQAIEDGVLVDVTEIARPLGFRVHTAITCGAVASLTEFVQTRYKPSGGEKDLTKYTPEQVRLASIRAMLAELRDKWLAQKENSPEFHWKLGDQVEMWALCGPGDDGEPVLTLMLEGED